MRDVPAKYQQTSPTPLPNLPWVVWCFFFCGGVGGGFGGAGVRGFWGVGTPWSSMAGGSPNLMPSGRPALGAKSNIAAVAVAVALDVAVAVAVAVVVAVVGPSVCCAIDKGSGPRLCLLTNPCFGFLSFFCLFF